jgi:lipopolysaccharide export LptBFGC system permease protein LptF
VNREAGVLAFELVEGVIDRIREGRETTDVIFFDTYELKLSPGNEVDGQNENNLFRGRAETPTGELSAAAARLSDPIIIRTYSLEWHERWARPAAAFLLTLIGLPLGASFRARGRNFPLLTALVIFILYYLVSSLGWTLGEAGRMSPAAGMWAANVLLAVLGLYLLRRINRNVPVDPMEFLRRLLKRFQTQ